MSKKIQEPKVWLITGCSSGLGRALASHVIQGGDRVAVTARNVDSIKELLTGNMHSGAPYALDVTNPQNIETVIAEVVERFGRIDVLVNNAGVGHFSAIEESDESRIHEMFDVNFFGLSSMIKAVLPQMRKQRSGHIVNVASAGGIVAFPGVGYYNASKWAVFGLSESLQKEIAHLGIRVTVAAPSGMRVRDATDAAHFHLPEVRNTDYKQTVGAMRQSLLDSFGKQPGNPERAAQAVVKAVENVHSPFRLFLGEASVSYAKQRSDELYRDAVAWEEVSNSVDYDDSTDENF